MNLIISNKKNHLLSWKENLQCLEEALTAYPQVLKVLKTFYLCHSTGGKEEGLSWMCFPVHLFVTPHGASENLYYIK